jgi:hypothetical protein
VPWLKEALNFAMDGTARSTIVLVLPFMALSVSWRGLKRDKKKKFAKLGMLISVATIIFLITVFYIAIRTE